MDEVDEVVAVVAVLLLGITSPSSRRAAQDRASGCRVGSFSILSMLTDHGTAATAAARERPGRRERYGAGVGIGANEEGPTVRGAKWSPVVVLLCW